MLKNFHFNFLRSLLFYFRSWKLSNFWTEKEKPLKLTFSSFLHPSFILHCWRWWLFALLQSFPPSLFSNRHCESWWWSKRNCRGEWELYLNFFLLYFSQRRHLWNVRKTGDEKRKWKWERKKVETFNIKFSRVCQLYHSLSSFVELILK